MTYTISKADWHISLSEYIRLAKDGDTIIMHSDAQKELAIRAKERMCPEKAIEFVVSSELE